MPSELCPSDEASRWCGREQEVLEESRREPTFASERRSPQHGTPQRSGEWARATRRARRAAQDHPAELAYLWNLCRSRNTDSTRNHLEQESVKSTTLHTYQQHHAEWMRWCRQSQKNLSTPTSLEMAMIHVLRPSLLQGFDVGNRSDSPCVSVPLPPRLGPVSSKRRRPNQKGPEGLGTPCARELEGPAAVDPRARPRIGDQPARQLRDVNGDAPGHRYVSTSRRDRVAERKQFGSATPGSGGAFRPMGPALVPSRRRDCKQNPAARRHNYLGLVKPPVAGTAGRPDCQDSKEGRKAVHLHHRSVRCGSKAASGVLRHHAARDVPFRAEQRQGVTLHKTIEEVQKRCRWLASTSLRRYEKSARLSRISGRPPGTGPRQDSGARSKSACEPDASRPQRTRLKRAPPKPSAERRRGSRHFQALNGAARR